MVRITCVARYSGIILIPWLYLTWAYTKLRTFTHLVCRVGEILQKWWDQVSGVPKWPPLKTEKSSDLTNYFSKRVQFNNKIKMFSKNVFGPPGGPARLTDGSQTHWRPTDSPMANRIIEVHTHRLRGPTNSLEAHWPTENPQAQWEPTGLLRALRLTDSSTDSYNESPRTNWGPID